MLALSLFVRDPSEGTYLWQVRRRVAHTLKTAQHIPLHPPSACRAVEPQPLSLSRLKSTNGKWQSTMLSPESLVSRLRPVVSTRPLSSVDAPGHCPLIRRSRHEHPCGHHAGNGSDSSGITPQPQPAKTYARVTSS